MTEKMIVDQVYRRWGSWEVIKQGNYDDVQYKVKFLMIDPGKAISLQYHEHRDEYWVIMRGLAKVSQAWDLSDPENDTYYHGVGDMLYIPRMSRHKIENIGDEPLMILELQMGSECDEEDITRLEKIEDGEGK